MRNQKTIIEIARLGTSDLLDERNNFLIFNNEDGRTYRVDDLQMDQRFLSANSLYGESIRRSMNHVASWPIGVSSGNDTVSYTHLTLPTKRIV